MPDALPASWYTDSDVYATERSRVFAANWTPFCPEREIVRPGGWRAACVNGWPIVAVRDKGGALRAFHNVCRHRGAAVVPDGHGTAEILRCPYHGWAYRLDGTLALTPRFGDDGFDATRHGLLPVAIDAWRGMVFVRIGADGPGLVDWLGSIAELCEPFPTADMDFHGTFAVEGDANWKTYCDNTVEGYHLPHVHARLTSAVDPAAIAIKPYDEGRCVAFHVTYRADGAGMRGRDGLWFYRFPGFQATLSANAFKVERIEAIGPGRMRSTSWQWFRGLDEAARADAFAWARTIVEEDLVICASVQRNLEAGAFERGVLSPLQESNVALFQGHVREALGLRHEG